MLSTDLECVVTDSIIGRTGLTVHEEPRGADADVVGRGDREALHAAVIAVTPQLAGRPLIIAEEDTCEKISQSYSIRSTDLSRKTTWTGNLKVSSPEEQYFWLTPAL